MSGFLGSGKTTLLLHVLEYCKAQNMKPAVILNELGSVNVESHLFQEENVFELLDGCICCSIQDVPSISRRALKKWLKSLPEGIIRGKGYVSLKGERGIYPFQYSSNQVHISDFSQKQTTDPCIVLIGKDVDITHVQNSYTAQISIQ
ncbi:GTP-binding protein [Ectobacillus funiculus]